MGFLAVSHTLVLDFLVPLHIRYPVAFLFHFVILSTMHASRPFPPRFGLRCSVLSSMRRPVFSPLVSWWDICEFTVGVYAEFLVSYTVHSSRK